MTEITPRAVITGMGIVTPLGDSPATVHAALCTGLSAIGPWRSIDVSAADLKIGGDLGAYDPLPRLEALKPRLSAPATRSLRRMLHTLPWSMRLGLLPALTAWLDAGLDSAPPADPARVAVIAAGHTINSQYINRTGLTFETAPGQIDALYALHSLDCIHAAAVGELIAARGAVYSLGSACASGLHALRAGLMEIAGGQADVVVIHAPAAELSAVELHSMALMQTVSLSGDGRPQQASRPFDRQRDGFVPAHGTATVVLESPAHAHARGARIHAGVLAVAATSDGCHLPLPNAGGEARAMAMALSASGLTAADIDMVSAHATSTPAGDAAEITALRQVLGAQLDRIPINAAKSMLGHCLWAAPLVELVVAIEQMRTGLLHPTLNLTDPDPEFAGLNLCAGAPQRQTVRALLKNSFGFGGTNAACILAHPDA